MTDKETPTRSSKMEKAEGSRWTSDPDTVEVSERDSEGIGETNDNSGAISNRPFEDESDHQRNLPDRGTRRNEERGDGDVER